MAKVKKRGRKRGRKRHVTLRVVKRVADRVAVGLTLELACASEGDPCINPESFQKALERHPEFVGPYQQGKADFLEVACRRLVGSNDLANLRWLLPRRYPDLFSKPESAPSIHLTQQQAVLGIPEDVLQLARDLAINGNGHALEQD